MKLYHGTSGKALKRILQKGIRTRGLRKSHWDCESSDQCVYLSDAYAPYFANVAASKTDSLAVVLEVDVDQLPTSVFVPDEDFMEQATRQIATDNGVQASMEERTAWYRKRLLEFTDYWRDSLEKLGTCAHIGDIPRRAITRYVSWDPRKDSALVMVFDPTITLINYQLCGDRYRCLTADLFGDPRPEPETGLAEVMRQELPEATTLKRVTL